MTRAPEPPPMDEALLQAYVDGRLSPEEAKRIEAYLASRPDERERLAAYARANAALQDHFDRQLDEPVPVRLLRAARRPRARWPLRAAAAVALLVAGAAAGWIGRGAVEPATPVSFALQAAVAHDVFSVETRHPVEVTGAEAEHLKTWLDKRLGGSVPAPDLSALGYRLVGGRLLATDSGPAAQLMYEDERGERMTLFFRTDATDQVETTWRLEREGDVGVYYWVQQGKAFAVVGPVGDEELKAAGHIATP